MIESGSVFRQVDGGTERFLVVTDVAELGYVGGEELLITAVVLTPENRIAPVAHETVCSEADLEAWEPVEVADEVEA